MELTLTTEEREALESVLDAVLADLRYEIADTDGSVFREQLKARRRLLEGIAARLRAPMDVPG